MPISILHNIGISGLNDFLGAFYNSIRFIDAAKKDGIIVPLALVWKNFQNISDFFDLIDIPLVSEDLRVECETHASNINVRLRELDFFLKRHTYAFSCRSLCSKVYTNITTLV